MNDRGLKSPPASVEAEQAVLGGLMLDNSAIGYVLDACNEGDFFRRDHRMIFSAIMKCDEKGDPFDVISLAETLSNDGELENSGGLHYLSGLVGNTPSAANIKTYARIVREKALERKLLQSAGKITDLVYDQPELSPQEKIDAAGALLMELTDDKSSTGPLKISTTLPGWLVGLDERFNNGGELTGLSSGFTDFDKLTAGLQKSDLIIIAGRPSMGKSTLAVNIAENVSVNNGIPSAIFSLEMPTNQLTNRMISSLGGVLHENLRTGRIGDDEWPRITSAASRIKNAPIFIDETAGLSISELRNRARRLKKQEGVELIVVDYLQLMRSPGAERRLNEIGEISRGLKSIAKELNIPVICLSQLSRGVESRPDRRPLMSDLRESGDIEQDADLVVFIYRDEVYNEESPDKGTAEIIIRKQRNGNIGKVRLNFDGAMSRFRNLSY